MKIIKDSIPIAPLIFDFVLKEANNEIAEVTITEGRPIFERKIDRTVFNVENASGLAGQNLLDVLRQAPGVSIDGRDNISVNGKSGVRLKTISNQFNPLTSKI